MQANEDWKVSDYQDGYLKGILALFKESYPETSLWREDFFKWQNFRNPCGSSIIKLAINKVGEVVGFYCVTPQRYWINGKKVLGSVSLNTLVRADFRGRGIFTILAEECFEECQRQGISFTLGFPNQNSYHGFINKLGFTDLGEIPLLIKPYNLFNLLKFKLKVLEEKEQRKETKGPRKEEVLRVSNLWKEVIKQKKNVADRGEDFLLWRLGWPRRFYKVVSVKQGDGEIAAYAILGVIRIGGLLNGLVVDIKIDSDKTGEAKNLMRMIDVYWKETKVDQVGCMFLEGESEFELLRSFGYINCPDFLKPQPVRLVVKWHGANMPFGFEKKNKWLVSFLDYDVA